ncbi:MAG: DUF98 domain-containing protein [Methanobrevibacter sp.]|nr:DUF98 domain-containing protein [Methanobrevibacter sp.]MBQ6627313.1 DUF98 domain-containing protein [Methanobrevibacter sp.]
MISEGTIIENQIRGKIKELEERYGIELSTTQKILLSIREPITIILDVLYGEVNLFMLGQHVEEANADIAKLLDLNEGEKVDYREVIVHKHGRPLVYALSYVPISRCSEKVINDLCKEKLTTGNIIEKYNVETLRRINNISIEEPTPQLQELFKTDENMLTREYVMVQHGKIKIWTKEAYPLSYFRE